MNYESTISQLRSGTTLHSTPDIPQCMWNAGVGRELKQLAQACSLTPLTTFPAELPEMGAGFYYAPELPYVYGYKVEMNGNCLILTLLSRGERDPQITNYHMATFLVQAQKSSSRKGTELIIALLDLFPPLYDEAPEVESTVQLVKLLHAVGEHLDDFELWITEDGIYASVGRGRNGAYSSRFKQLMVAKAA